MAEIRRNSIKERAKKIPIKVRLFVDFQYEWYKLHINPSRFHTLKEEQLATKWAKKMTKQVLAQYKKWESDGSPK